MSDKLQTTSLSLVELYKNQDAALLMPRDVAMKFLNVDPPASWVKVHPYIKGYKYLPIDKVEFLLAVIFREYRIEIRGYGMVLNAAVIHVRVHYKDLTSGEWTFHDGIGALEPQTAKGSGGLKLDASNINPGALAMALPIAKSVAVKDACDHLGAVFGANLNRKDTLNFAQQSESVEAGRMKRLIEAAATLDELEALRSHLNEELYELFENKLNSLK